ncbi:hypothetical protein ACIHCM_35090 [Streptomyces sp. NPDC052023]|uniref:hypothetical protein n=1 Tax=Streptomyces sp. NPDC052023 TaxID=3365681 RepID=UPI0037D0EFFB
MSRTSGPFSELRYEAERLHDAFSEVADAVTPSPVPLAAIERAGRARRRRRAAGLAIGCCLLLAPLTFVTARAVLPDHSPPERTEVASRPTQSDTSAEDTVRVVVPGERVDAGAGVELWLTGEGKHWSTPEMDYQFRSVVDGNIDLGTPGIGLMTEPLGDRYFLSGIYVTKHSTVRVVVDTSDGKVAASVVRLAGKPGWGVWYTDAPLHDNLTINSVTLYDKQGEEVATTTPTQP